MAAEDTSILFEWLHLVYVSLYRHLNCLSVRRRSEESRDSMNSLEEAYQKTLDKLCQTVTFQRKQGISDAWFAADATAIQ